MTFNPRSVQFRNGDPIAAATRAVEEIRAGVETFRTETDERLTTELRALTERIDQIETRAQRPGGTGGNADAAQVELRALATFLRTRNDTELRAAATDSNIDGGYFVLPTVDTTIRSLMTDLSPLRGLAEVVTISSNVYERFYSLGKRGAQWVSERGTRPQDTGGPELAHHRYQVSELYAAPVTTRQILDDASVDIASWLINNATHDFSETEGDAFMRGDGVAGKPTGILHYGTTNQKDFVRPWGKHQHVPAGHASAPTDDNLAKALVALMMTLRTPYRANARWLMNRTTAIRVRQIQDTAKRFLWAPLGNLIEGEQGNLLGFPVEYDDSMDDIGENTYPIAFGDIRQGYVIVDRAGVRINIDEVTQKGRVIFDTYKRVGGGAGDFNAIKFLKVATA